MCCNWEGGRGNGQATKNVERMYLIWSCGRCERKGKRVCVGRKGGVGGWVVVVVVVGGGWGGNWPLCAVMSVSFRTEFINVLIA